ncbi:Uncharacterized protein dnm_034960 [Desulfonema magnum]|uniref:Uncharacterized protein n=1 Tax=Desulfonema magnum TaxID=45655 RepID=A0A975GN71_9BACT|nr:Uncharacterized protein dnm_034960 [Desulfonema magnum]
MQRFRKLRIPAFAGFGVNSVERNDRKKFGMTEKKLDHRVLYQEKPDA